MQDDNTNLAVPSEAFSELVAHLLMGLEEVHRSCHHTTHQENNNNSSKNQSPLTTLQQVFDWHGHLEALLGDLDQLHRWTLDRGDSASVEADMFRHVQNKFGTVASSTLDHMMHHITEPTLDEEEEETMVTSSETLPDQDQLWRDFQGVIAQTTEMVLRMHILATTSPESASSLPENDQVTHWIDQYVAFQRSTLRARVKPIIFQLVQDRKRGFPDPNSSNDENNHKQVSVYDEEADEEQDARVIYEKHHAQALAFILGQAAALANPLLAWIVTLPPPGADTDPIASATRQLCTKSLQVIQEQALQLTETVSTWFWEDRPIDKYLHQAQEPTLSSEMNDVASTSAELGFLDGLVEEMALAALLLAQYKSLTDNIQQETYFITESSSTNENSPNAKIHELLQEWSWKYASLERTLAVQQWQAALHVAQPVQIVMGSSIYVPSVVEDAQFLSTRALERAASTNALQAMGTVAHAIAHDVWSTDHQDANSSSSSSSLTVHQAILQERGCWIEPEKEDTPAPQQATSSKKKKDFSSALLDAFDEDLGPTQPKSPPRSGPPLSGSNFLAAAFSQGPSTEMRLLQMHAKFCAMNGIQAAAGACRTLVACLDGLLPEEHTTDGPQADDGGNTPPSAPASQSDRKALAMIQLAREELFRYAHTYEEIRQEKVVDVINDYCIASHLDGPMLSVNGGGLLLDHIASFLAHESFLIPNATVLQKAESEDRLETELMAPLKAYLFLKQISLRSEYNVLRSISKELVKRVVDVILAVLWKQKKDFNDWGSLLFSKEVDMIQQYIQECLTPPADSTNGGSFTLADHFERLAVVVAILQMEAPSEWLVYNNPNVVLTAEELQQTMQLRTDWPEQAIRTVVDGCFPPEK